jgi:ferredoxin
MAVKRRIAYRLLVDPVRCDGFGHCAELAPELIHLDEWGYPLIATEPFPANDREALRSAHLAVRGCPRSALRLEKVNLA